MVSTHLYVRGPATYRNPHARVETKPSPVYGRGRRDTGGGYERIRSWEHDPTRAGAAKSDVYAYHHRLLAVAWLLPDDEPLDLSALDGVDVHHAAPEVDGERGVEWDNREACLSLREHGRHSEITNAERMAWAKDAQRSLDEPAPPTDACGDCGEAEGVLARSEDWDGLRCIECAHRASEGATIEVV